ncbi:hypothetical protein TNCV_4599791 [Trichonephila clavipes]|nr:hypothetical protein TNCV_4599791 [Trichonephila clavipes]
MQDKVIKHPDGLLWYFLPNLLQLSGQVIDIPLADVVAFTSYSRHARLERDLAEFNVGKARICDWRKIVESLNNTVLILLARLLKTDRQQSNRCTIKLIVRFIFGLPRKEDGETAEFLTDDDVAEAVTQEPMEEEGSDDETQCDKKDVVPPADSAAALRYLEQQPDTTPADVLFMRRWRNYASSKRLSSLRQKNN